MRPLFIILFGIIASDISGQVTLQNGSANYQIPIFSFSDAKTGLGIGVSLNYSSGNGLLVSDHAPNTGQGWNLLTGGAIFRKQNGEPDDQNSIGAFPLIPNANQRGFNEQIAVYDEDYQSIPWTGDPYSRYYIDNYYPNGFMYSEFPLDMVDNNNPLQYSAPRELALLPRFKSNMDKKWGLSRRALTDRQQDVFIYSFNGVSGEFVIGKDGNPLLINDSKVIIEKSTSDLTGQNIRTRINSFTIKDVTGTIYKFSAYELSEVMKFKEISSEGSTSFRKIKSSGEPTGKYTIQKWLLTEIINPATQEKIVFEYEDYDIDIIYNKTPTYQNTVGQTVESVQIYEERARGKLKRLKNILLPDGHKIQFFYNTSLNRVDVPNDYPLAQVKITYNNEDAVTYNLNYGYFLKKQIKNYTDPIDESDKRFARLCLTSVQKTGTNLFEPAYEFSYYTGIESSDPKDIVPPFDCMAQDGWGYYNGNSLINNDDPNPSKETLRTLLKNPDVYRYPTEAAKFGLLKSVENPFSGKLTFEYEQNDSKDSDNPAVTKITGGVRVFKTILSDGISSANDIVTTYNYKKSDGSTSGWGYEAPTFLSSREIKVWNASTLDGYVKEGALVYNITTAMLNKIVKEAANKAFNDAVSENFRQQQAEDPAAAVPMPQWAAIYAAFVISGLIDRLIVLFNPTDFFWVEIYNFYPNQNQNPIGINYSRVEVLNTSLPGGTGKIISEFTAPANVRSEIPAYTIPYSPKQRFPAWKYGLPLKTLVYNQAGGNPVKEVTNTYSVFANTVTGNNNKSCKVDVVRPESANCWVGAQTNTLPITDFSWEFYYPITGRSELTNTTEKNYSPSGILSQTDVTTTYNNDYFDNTATTTKSNGDIIKVKKYYTNDYNNISTAIQEMKAKNMIAVPISTETWLTKPGGTEYLLDATINEFTLLVNGEIKIKKIYKLESTQPLLKSLIGEQNPNVLVRDNNYFKEQLNFNYDNTGNLMETTSPDGRVKSEIYDYNKRFAVAEVTNASQNQIAYSSFETDEPGNWTIAPGSTIVTERFITGKRSFSGTLTRSLTSTGDYTVTLWSITAGNVSVNGQSGTVKKILGDWTLYEWKLINVNNIQIVADNIDEVRLYPVTARMSTTTYDPKFGKTAECDVNNRIIYYEYDDLGRLKTIKDENRNVLKTYEYNYKN